MINKLVFWAALLFVVIFLGKTLNPWSGQMFDGHDVTQASRIKQFTLNLQNFKIPPRLAPDFSFKLGFPVFNFYAPFSYWVTAAIHLIGFDITASLKLSYLFSLLIAFIGMCLFLHVFFDDISSILGATLYVSSPWMATEIFIRANLAEVWFMALFPLCLFLLSKNAVSSSKISFIVTTIFLSFILTVHNIFSLLFMPIALGFIFIFKKGYRKNLLALLIGFLLSSYFTLPAVAELSLTHAKSIAQNTPYYLHFLCPGQLWSGVWGYGGSVPGCNDGMAFMLGKIPIVLGILGGLIFISIVLTNKSDKKNAPLFAYILLLTVISIFMTIYYSKFVWDILAPVIAVFQFPWRFLIFGIFGLAFFVAFLFSLNKSKYIKLLAVFITFFAVLYNAKFFTRTEVPVNKFNDATLSSSFIKQEAAYKIPEYLPKEVDYKKWLLLEPKKDHSEKNEPSLLEPVLVTSDKKSVQIKSNGPFYKSALTESQDIVLNIHYFPFWRIDINNKRYIPKNFDSLGRPMIKLDQGVKEIVVTYSPTVIEHIGDGITLITFVLLIAIIASSNNLWKKLQNDLA